VKLGSELKIKTTLVDADKEKFILHSQMLVDGKTAAVSEMLQAHVNTRPTPKITEMPELIYMNFTNLLKQTANCDTPLRSRKLSLTK
jgi:acyl-CoA thioesterase FadM